MALGTLRVEYGRTQRQREEEELMASWSYVDLGVAG